MGQKAKPVGPGSEDMFLRASSYDCMLLSAHFINTLAVWYMIPDTDPSSQRQMKTYALLHLQRYEHCSNCLLRHSVWMPCRIAVKVRCDRTFISAMLRTGIVDDAMITWSALCSAVIYQTGKFSTDTPTWSPWLSRASIRRRCEHHNGRRKTSRNTYESSMRSMASLEQIGDEAVPSYVSPRELPQVTHESPDIGTMVTDMPISLNSGWYDSSRKGAVYLDTWKNLAGSSKDWKRCPRINIIAVDRVPSLKESMHATCCHFSKSPRWIPSTVIRDHETVSSASPRSFFAFVSNANDPENTPRAPNLCSEKPKPYCRTRFILWSLQV
jgi:hypothetical protein